MTCGQKQMFAMSSSTCTHANISGQASCQTSKHARVWVVYVSKHVLRRIPPEFEEIMRAFRDELRANASNLNCNAHPLTVPITEAFVSSAQVSNSQQQETL